MKRKKDLKKKEKSAKGITKNVTKKTIHHKDYYDCLFDQTYSRIQQIIVSKNHNLYIVK